jgi:hypothetical protein
LCKKFRQAEQAMQESRESKNENNKADTQDVRNEFFDELGGFESDSDLEKELNALTKKKKKLNNNGGAKKKKKQKLKKPNSVSGNTGNDLTFSDHVIFDSFGQPLFSPLFSHIKAVPKDISKLEVIYQGFFFFFLNE